MSDIRDKYKFVIKKVQDLEDGSAEYVDCTCVGLTEKAGRYEGIIYKYGEVTIPNEDEVDSEGALPFRFEYDIVDNIGFPIEYFKDDFFELIGDILVDIITNEGATTIDNDREDSAIQLSP